MYSRRGPSSGEKSLSPDKRMKERKFKFSLDEPDSFNEPAKSEPSDNVRMKQRGSVQLMEPISQEFFNDTKFVDGGMMAAPPSLPQLSLGMRGESKSSIATTTAETPAVSKDKPDSETCY